MAGGTTTTAFKKIDVQGTKTYILPLPATAWTDCSAAITAIHAGKEAMCPQTLGDLTRTREVTEYGCISSNDSQKAAGKMSYGDITLELLFAPDDTAGQKLLFDAMEGNTPVIIAMEAPNADTSVGSTGASGDIIWTKAMVVGDAISFPANGLVGYSVTVSPYGGFTRCAAIKGTT